MRNKVSCLECFKCKSRELHKIESISVWLCQVYRDAVRQTGFIDKTPLELFGQNMVLDKMGLQPSQQGLYKRHKLFGVGNAGIKYGVLPKYRRWCHSRLGIRLLTQKLVQLLHKIWTQPPGESISGKAQQVTQGTDTVLL